MNLHHVNLVAHYESKLLSRSVTFFILVLVTIGILLFFNIWVYSVFNEPWYFSEYDHDDLETTWTIFAAFRKDLLFLPVSMPYANAVFFNILQSVIVIFVGGDFVMRHRMGRANEVLEIRSLGNREYILGKCLGQIRLILWLNLVSVLIALMINLFGSEQVCSPLFYLFYFFTLTFPSLLFIMGLTVLVKSLVRPEVLAILILLFFGCLNMLVVSTIDHGVFDYLALCVPNLFSTLTGHPALGGYLLQRLVFLFIGFGLFSFAICFLRRLPNHVICKRLHVMDGLMFWGVAFIFMLYYLVPFHRVDERREAYVTMYKKYNHKAKVNTLSHDIIFRQENKRYEATSRMVVKNRGTRIIDTLIFYLNPGLNVDRVIAREKTLDFHREAQVLNVVGEKFFPGDSLSIEIRYAGTIDESVCYPDIPKEEFWHQKLRDVFLCTGRRFAFLEESYTLLTPECLWYPVSVPGVDVENPFMSRGDFTRYRLQVVHPGSRIAVSQGTVSKVGDTLQFLNHQDMFGITLSMGLFQEDNIALEKCSYVFYNVRDHFYLEGVFRNISSEMKLDVCQEYFTKDCFRFPYPFQKMAMVEVPVSFSTYKRNWRECTGFSYPEIIFQPEREGGWVDYERELKKSRKSNPNRTLSDQVSVVFSYEIQKNKSLIEPLFTERWCKEYSEHLILVSSEEFPAINRLVLMLNTHFYGSVSDFMRAGKKNREMKATEILSQKNLLTCMQDPTVKEEIEKILYIKGTQLQKYILTKISWEKWTSFMDDFLNRYRYQEVTYEQFALELQELYGLDILPYTRKLYKEEGVPSFVVKDMNLYGMIDDGDKLMYSFKIWNRGLVDGVVTVEGSHYDPERASNKVFMENHEIRVNESKEFRFSAPIGFELNLWTNFSWNLL